MWPCQEQVTLLIKEMWLSNWLQLSAGGMDAGARCTTYNYLTDWWAHWVVGRPSVGVWGGGGCRQTERPALVVFCGNGNVTNAAGNGPSLIVMCQSAGGQGGNRWSEMPVEMSTLYQCNKSKLNKPFSKTCHIIYQVNVNAGMSHSVLKHSWLVVHNWKEHDMAVWSF